MKKFKTEIIDKLLLTIKNNQEYLFQEENIKQFAKLFFIFDVLHTSGRIYYKRMCFENGRYYFDSFITPKNDFEKNIIYLAQNLTIGYEDSYETFYNIINSKKTPYLYEKECEFYIFNNWETTDLKLDIKEIVDSIITNKLVKKLVNYSYKYYQKEEEKRKQFIKDCKEKQEQIINDYELNLKIL